MPNSLKDDDLPSSLKLDYLIGLSTKEISSLFTG